ncbi:NAD(P)H-dependent oxidoreductase [Massilia sp. TS11]|uniref:NAD(P)H-dependent oxidoreductase n=1 Tax=Massilia sp. TS11 TaxID=2908003 RepID=UPI001EDB2054|nr:NAD(P)H-dependent oxidoreductase [Massilia sp. TS11]MCG2586090.1 NAD(P)H-dependent oxidoreductase [Massilia sp. TS11]
MGKHILILQGHPDPSARHLCHALADAYAAGAIAGGHALRLRDIAELDFPLLRSEQDWEHGSVPPSLAAVQHDLAWAEHLVVIYPLWLGDMPALLKGFLEQVARPGFAFRDGRAPALGGRSAHLVVTMGMPAFIYRWWYGAHSLLSFKRNILHFVGIRPVRATLIGGVGQLSPERAQRWLDKLEACGQQAR